MSSLIIDEIIHDKLNNFYELLFKETDSKFHSDIAEAKIKNQNKISLYLFFMTKDKVESNMKELIQKFEIKKEEIKEKLFRYGELFLELRELKIEKKNMVI